MKNEEFVKLLNTREINKMIVGACQCEKYLLKEEFKDIDDETLISYAKAYLVQSYESIDNKYEKSKYANDINQGCIYDKIEDFIKGLNGTIAEMGETVNKEAIDDIKNLEEAENSEIYKLLSEYNKLVSSIIANHHRFYSIKELRKKTLENKDMNSYFESIISEEELDVIENASYGYFWPNQIAHMLYDEKNEFFYHCDNNVNNKDELLKKLILNTNERNPQFDIVFPNGIIAEYHLGEVRIKRYTFKQLVKYTKLYFATYFDEMSEMYDEFDHIIFNELSDNERKGREMIINSFIAVRDLFEEYQEIYTQKMINNYQKQFVKIKETSKKYHL